MIFTANFSPHYFSVASPPDCNVTVFGRPVFVIPVGLDWGYAGLEPNGDTFCLGKGNFDGTSFEFWLDLNLGTGCSSKLSLK